MGTITPIVHNLQVWTRENDPIRPDVFRLEDGRIIEITQGSQVDGERTRHAVWIIDEGWKNRAIYGDAHRHVKGCAGSIFYNRKHGNWELYPIERAITRNQRGTYENHGIHRDRNATPRIAALGLINLSDKLQQKNSGFYFSKTITRKAGPWEITPLAKYADGTDQAQEPNSVRLDHDHQRHYIARHDKHGSIRLIAERERNYNNGYRLAIYVTPAPGIYDYAENVQQAPGKVKAWIESRIRSI